MRTQLPELSLWKIGKEGSGAVIYRSIFETRHLRAPCIVNTMHDFSTRTDDLMALFLSMIPRIAKRKQNTSCSFSGLYWRARMNFIELPRTPKPSC